MPIQEMSSDQVRPTYVARPDERFATSFMSLINRDYAVRGEVIMDKQTGEIFAKRIGDGRVVSFFQNKQYLYDIMLRLKILIGSNPSFLYPEDDDRALYTSTDYDLMTVNNEVPLDILKTLTTETVFDTGETTDVNRLRKKVRFKVSKNSNGVFCRLTSRDNDKSLIEWLTSQYDYLLSNYTGENSLFNAEKAKLLDNTDWKDTNAILYYNVTAIRTNGTNRTFSIAENVRINEESCIKFPEEAIDLSDVDYYLVEFEHIDYYKLHFIIQYGSELSPTFESEYEKFKYADEKIYIYYCNIGRFVDKGEDIDLLGNEFIVALLEVPHMITYMEKVATLYKNAAFIRSIDRPNATTWTVNNVWAEMISKCHNNGQITYYDSVTDIVGLELFIANNVEYDPNYPILRTSEAAGLSPDTYFKLATHSGDSYTTDELDAIIAAFNLNMRNNIRELVSTDINNVADGGLYIEHLHGEDGDE